MPGYSFYGSEYEGFTNPAATSPTTITVDTNPYTVLLNGTAAYETYEQVIASQTAINAAYVTKAATLDVYTKIALAITDAETAKTNATRGNYGTDADITQIDKDIATLNNAKTITETYIDTTGVTNVTRYSTQFAMTAIQTAIGTAAASNTVTYNINDAKTKAAAAASAKTDSAKNNAATNAKDLLRTSVTTSLLDAKTKAETAKTTTDTIITSTVSHTTALNAKNSSQSTTYPAGSTQTNQTNKLGRYNTKVTDYNTKFLPSKESVTQLSEQANKTFILLIIWFIIALFIFIITILTVLNESKLNPFVIIIVSIFLLYIIFYFTNNIYNMFK